MYSRAFTSACTVGPQLVCVHVIKSTMVHALQDFPTFRQEVFLSCERERFIELCSRSGCPLEVASSTVTLKGFKPALMPETASNLKL